MNIIIECTAKPDDSENAAADALLVQIAHESLGKLGVIMHDSREELRVVDAKYAPVINLADHLQNSEPPQPIPEDVANALEAHRQKTTALQGCMDRILDATTDFISKFPDHPEFRDSAMAELGHALPSPEQLHEVALQSGLNTVS